MNHDDDVLGVGVVESRRPGDVEEEAFSDGNDASGAHVKVNDGGGSNDGSVAGNEKVASVNDANPFDETSDVVGGGGSSGVVDVADPESSVSGGVETDGERSKTMDKEEGDGSGEVKNDSDGTRNQNDDDDDDDQDESDYYSDDESDYYSDDQGDIELSLDRRGLLVARGDLDHRGGRTTATTCLDSCLRQPFPVAIHACSLLLATTIAVAFLMARTTEVGRKYWAGGGSANGLSRTRGHGGGGGGIGNRPWNGATVVGPRLHPLPFPKDVIGTAYDPNGDDFRNDAGFVAPYWRPVLDDLLSKAATEAAATVAEGGGDVSGNVSMSDEGNHTTVTKANGEITANSSAAEELGAIGRVGGGMWRYADKWGPCFALKRTSHSIDWHDVVARESARDHPGEVYTHYERGKDLTALNGEPPYGMCRPGFLIIGAGKCGTSSLYHYITGHPRVLPASEKQVHYFRYHTDESMKWYLSHFPTVKAFLGSGAILTGEASPGYLPYPRVPVLTRQRLGLEPKLIVIARDPLDRAYSAYRYNYVEPALHIARKGRARKKHGAPKGMTDQYYISHNHIMTFEEMVVAELKVLRECLRLGGYGEKLTRDDPVLTYTLMREEAKRRDDAGLPPLVDMDGHCYGGSVSSSVPRAQWSDLIEAHPEKIVAVPNLHLVQSLVGRSLYTLPLEWWYAVFPPENFYLVCTEDLRDRASGAMSDLSSWLGLPAFDYGDVVKVGAFNVGGHMGYDTVTSWNETHEEERVAEDVPLSDEVRREFLEFVKPFNERLFDLVGKRCDGWR